jgi:hypothetical protein
LYRCVSKFLCFHVQLAPLHPGRPGHLPPLVSLRSVHDDRPDGGDGGGEREGPPSAVSRRHRKGFVPHSVPQGGEPRAVGGLHTELRGHFRARHRHRAQQEPAARCGGCTAVDHSVYPQRLKAPGWFQPLSLRSEETGFKLCFLKCATSNAACAATARRPRARPRPQPPPPERGLGEPLAAGEPQGLRRRCRRRRWVCTSSLQLTYSLKKAPGFKPRTCEVKSWASEFAFKFNLYRYTAGESLSPAAVSPAAVSPAVLAVAAAWSLL